MRFKKIILSAALLSTLFACKKVIDIPETNLIAGTDALKTVANCEQGIIGAYAGTSPDMVILLNSTFSDEVKKSEFYNAATTHEWQYSSVDVTIRDNFTAIYPLYTVIDRVNRVLAALPAATGGTDSARARIKGEALFLRAFAHFDLFRYYCGNYHPDSLAMVYMSEINPEPTAPFERIKMAPYFEKLKADLDTARTSLPAIQSDILRATRLAVIGLQARVALYTKDWAKAEAYATEYITALPLADKATFPAIWTDANTTEVAWKIKKTTAVSRLGSLYRGTSASASNIGTVTWQPTDKIWNSFDQTNDVRFAVYLKDEPLLVTAGRPSHLIKKYAGGTYATASENVADGKMFRTGEMYLIRAEARAEQDKFTGANSAESDLNDLRTARITGYTAETFASKDAAIVAVISERFKELAFEGHRFWDLKRRSLPVERDPAEAPSALGTTLPANNFRFVLPIPNTEIQANKLMKQNNGYF